MAVTIAGRRYQVSPRRLWLCAPILLPFILDVSMTLIGQPAGYWGSGFQSVDEANPIGRWLLQFHPLAYVDAQILVFSIYMLLIAVLPVKWAKILSIYLTVGHTYGWFSWLKYVLKINYIVRFGLIFIPALLLVYAFDRVDRIHPSG